MWFVLACFAPPPAPTADAILVALAPEGWEPTGCDAWSTVGLDTTTCSLRRGGQVAVVAAMTFEREEDAVRSWEAADAVGWQVGPVVVEVDVFDEAAATALLAAGPEPSGFRCRGGQCLRTEGDRPALVAPWQGLVSPGAVVQDGRVATVADRPSAEAVLKALRGQ